MDAKNIQYACYIDKGHSFFQNTVVNQS